MLKLLIWIAAWVIIARTGDPWVIGAAACINLTVAPSAPRRTRRPFVSQPEYQAAIKAIEEEQPRRAPSTEG